MPTSTGSSFSNLSRTPAAPRGWTSPATPRPCRIVSAPTEPQASAPGPSNDGTTHASPEPTLQWEPGPVVDSIEEVLRPRRERAAPRTDGACDFLLKILKDGPRVVTEVQ